MKKGTFNIGPALSSMALHSLAWPSCLGDGTHSPGR